MSIILKETERSVVLVSKKMVAWNCQTLILILAAMAICGQFAGAATRTANSLSFADVSAAILQAAQDDTVQLPAGSATWNGNITVTKAITIAGTGDLLTQISGGGFSLQPNSNRLARITNIHFFQSNWTASYIINCIGNCTNFRIDHCRFSRGSHVLNFGFPTSGTGPAFGVVDHNTFYNCNTAIFVADWERGDGASGDAAWARPLVPGDAKTVCIEDNLFTTDSEVGNALNNNNQMLYGAYGGRATFRHNTQVSTGVDDITSIDAHGRWAADVRGTLMFEVYDNVFHINRGYGFFHLRGGQHIFYNNTVTLTNGTQSTLIQVSDEEFYSGDRISNSYFWNNTLNGLAWVGPLTVRWSLAGGMGQTYWMHAPQVGQTFYPYVPLVYPHPLVTPGIEGGVSTNPVVNISPTNLVFGVINVNSTIDQSLVLANVGGGTLVGAASIGSPFSIEGLSSYALTNGASQMIIVRYSPTFVGSHTGVVTFTGNAGGSVPVNGSSALAVSNITFSATDGLITLPFVTNADNTISQAIQTTDPLIAGSAVYPFNIATAGDYIINANVYAPDGGANSLFVNIDSQPIAPMMIWNIPPYNGFQDQKVIWAGATGGGANVWSLGAGSHQLIIRGREANVKVRSITLELQGTASIPSPPGRLRFTTDVP
jgi:hypothetical protein